MKLLAPSLLAASLTTLGVFGSSWAAGGHDLHVMHDSAGQIVVSNPVLPTAENAKNLLNTTTRHREWVRVETSSGTVFAFVVYPDRSDRAPVVLVTEKSLGATDWARAAADQTAAAGFIAIVPDVSTDANAHTLAQLSSREAADRAAAVRAFGLSLQIANGQSGTVELDRADNQIHVAVSPMGAAPVHASYSLTPQTWQSALAFVSTTTHDKPVFELSGGHAHGAVALAANRPVASYPEKRPDLPAGYYTADAALAASKLHKEWITLDVGGVKVRTWVVLPAGDAKVGTVIVMQHGTGMDNWVQAVADQLAQEGYIAISPDIWSGTAPDGGGLESFKYLDDALLAGRSVSPEEGIRRYKAARDYALKLPRSNGKTASLGFCMGGTNSFRFAGDVPELNGAVVFYGTPPDDATMAKISAPVLAFYGENDSRVTSTVEPVTAAMKKLGKAYEPHIYPKATHSFLLFQEVAGNPVAVNDSWPRAMKFLRAQLASGT